MKCKLKQYENTISHSPYWPKFYHSECVGNDMYSQEKYWLVKENCWWVYKLTQSLEKQSRKVYYVSTL